MGKMIRCECGVEIRRDSEEQVLAAAWQHIDEEHPDKRDSYNDSQLRAIMEDD
jgi:hypothetical protein